MTNKKSQVLKAISEMNVSMLEVVLEENNTYQDADKSVFIDKISNVFDSLKAEKNTHLDPSYGSCDSEICTNRGCNGVAFVGNKSGSSLNLILVEGDNDYKDIYSCSNFKTKDKSITITKNYSLDIKADEKANFNPPNDKLKIFDDCKTAFSDIAKLKKEFDSKVVLNWVEKHSWLFNEIRTDVYFLPYFYRSIDNFRDLYIDLKNLSKYYLLEIPCFEALSELQSLQSKDELLIQNLLKKYNNLRSDLSKFYVAFDSEDFLILNHVKNNNLNRLKIDKNDFINIMQFKSDFDKFRKLTKTTKN